MSHCLRCALLTVFAYCAAMSAAPFTFSTGNPDGLIATGARLPQPGILGIETGDDFILTAPTIIQSATFTGLYTGSAPFSVGDVNVDLYHVFPTDSDTARTANVNTRMNSPADTEFTGRNALAGDLTFTTSSLNPSFVAANSILNGIFPKPNQLTFGEGPVTGTEVLFDVTFVSPFVLPPGHYFFVPTVQLASGEFFWLSAPKPIVAPGTPFNPDLQTWIRNQDLDPDWSRVGTDILGAAPANAAFSLSGTIVPEPTTMGLFVFGGVCFILGKTGIMRRSHRARQP